jgi:hypothetical protein
MPSFTYQDSEARKPYEEPGEYHVKIIDFDWKIARSSGNDVLSLKLQTDSGVIIYDNLVFTENAMWKIDHALKCFLPSKGVEAPKKGENFDMNNDWVHENLHQADGWVSLSKGTSTSGKTRNEVEAYLPPRKRPVQGSTTKPAAPATTSATTTKPAPAKPEPDDDEIPF